MLFRPQLRLPGKTLDPNARQGGHCQGHHRSPSASPAEEGHPASWPLFIGIESGWSPMQVEAARTSDQNRIALAFQAWKKTDTAMSDEA